MSDDARHSSVRRTTRQRASPSEISARRSGNMKPISCFVDKFDVAVMTRSKDHPIVTGIPKLPARCRTFVTSLLLSMVMTCLVSFVSTFRGVELSAGFASKWLAAWGVSWAIAFPLLLLVTPIARSLTAIVVRDS